MFFIFLKHMSNFMSIECYLLFDPKTYFLRIILNYKNSKFKHLVDNIAIDLLFYENFISMKDMRRKCNSMIDLSKFTSNKKNMKWSCSFNLQPSLLPKFNYVRPKKI